MLKIIKKYLPFILTEHLPILISQFRNLTIIFFKEVDYFIILRRIIHNFKLTLAKYIEFLENFEQNFNFF